MFRIVGVFENRSEIDPYWVYSPEQFTEECLMSENVFMQQFIENHEYGLHFTSQWFLLFDYREMSARNVPQLYSNTTKYKEF